jgi:hypothetical protein
MTKALIDRIDAALARADDNAGYEAFVLLRKNWPTIREALAAQPQATIDSIPSCGQENDYRRAQPQSSLEALQTVVDLIAANEFDPNILIGMINGYAKHALSRSRPTRESQS